MLRSSVGLEVAAQKPRENFNEATIEKSIADLEARLQQYPDDENFSTSTAYLFVSILKLDGKKI